MVKISEVVGQNPWWKYGTDFVQFDKHLREAKPVFFKRKKINLEKGKIYLLRGPRQVGKTTYLKETIKALIDRGISPNHILYLSLDFFTSRRELRNALNYFFNLTRDAPLFYLFLDEITSLEDWHQELKYLADRGISERGVIMATGSSAIKLKEKGERLPGRGLEGNEYLIKPLSFREFSLQSIPYVTSFQPKGEFSEGLWRVKTLLAEHHIAFSLKTGEIMQTVQYLLPFKEEIAFLFRIYLITGGLPGVVNHYLFDRYSRNREVIEPSVSEIFIRDVLGDMARLQKQEIVARQIFSAIIGRYGSRYSFTKLSKEIERTHITTIDYLEFLQESFICFVLYAYDFARKMPKWKGDKKVYFFDPFIFHAVKSYLRGEEVWKVIMETMENEELLSKLVEEVAISHFLLHREIPFLKTGETFLWFYYDKRGKEIDATFKENGKYTGIEIKYRSQVGGLKKKEMDFLHNYIILSREDVQEGESLVIPVDIFLSLLELSKGNV